MAHTITQSPSFSFTAVLSKIGTTLVAMMDALITANSRCQQIEDLRSLSDAQLAKKGLKREDIVAHVFSDRIWM